MRHRKDLKDIWNSTLCKDAMWSQNDIPFCPTIISNIPSDIITWKEAQAIHNQMSRKEEDYKRIEYVCFYLDDYKFDGKRSSIWEKPQKAISILEHFKGVITPDFSTYQDFPEPIKIYNTFRMRAFGYWCGKNGLEVINNVRWGTPESYRYCFDGIEKNSIICIGTVGGSPARLLDKNRFEKGFTEMIKRLSPKTILVYGSANYSCFDKLRQKEIEIIAYESSTERAFARRRNEQRI